MEEQNDGFQRWKSHSRVEQQSLGGVSGKAPEDKVKQMLNERKFIHLLLSKSLFLSSSCRGSNITPVQRT